MGRKPSMVTVKKTFEDMVEFSRSLHAAIRPYTVRSYEGIAENPLHPIRPER